MESSHFWHVNSWITLKVYLTQMFGCSNSNKMISMIMVWFLSTKEKFWTKLHLSVVLCKIKLYLEDIDSMTCAFCHTYTCAFEDFHSSFSTSFTHLKLYPDGIDSPTGILNFHFLLFNLNLRKDFFCSMPAKCNHFEMNYKCIYCNLTCFLLARCLAHSILKFSQTLQL